MVITYVFILLVFYDVLQNSEECEVQSVEIVEFGSSAEMIVKLKPSQTFY